MSVLKKCVSWLAVLMVLFAFATGASAAKMEKVIIVQPNFLVPWLPIYIAERLGYFTDEGLEVSFTTVMGGHNVRAAVISGNAHFGLTGYEQVLSTYEHGKSSKMIMTTTLKHPWSYIGAKGVKSIADFKGKKIDGGLEASSYRSFARAVVKFGGLDPDKDVFFVNIPRGTELAALKNGQVAGVLGIDMMKIELLNRGFPLLADMTDDVQHREVLGYDVYPLFVVQVNDDYIEKHPENIQKFTNAVVRAMYWQKENSAEIIAETVRPLFGQTDRDVFTENIKHNLKALSYDGFMSEEAHSAAEKFGLEVRFIKAPVERVHVVDETFLKKAHEKISQP